jgi:DNA-3-methyladenine glycosylase I
MKLRCPWLNLKNKEYIEYHDNEWGIPVFDDDALFAALILEGAQAGLSWEIVLKKREEYFRYFDGLKIDAMAKISDQKLEEALLNTGLIRNRLKIYSIKKNAVGIQDVQRIYGSFSDYLWGKVNKKPIKQNFKNIDDYPDSDDLSKEISKELKRFRLSFVGPKIIYAYLQAIGIYQAHSIDCFLGGDSC